MASFSLLQLSLDQTITRESLEEASDAVPSIARTDCAHLQRDLFGIVVSNLSFSQKLRGGNPLAFPPLEPGDRAPTLENSTADER
ncbi:MAG: hypothetical protein ACRDBP_15310 [Luteolibacter sp.]